MFFYLSKEISFKFINNFVPKSSLMLHGPKLYSYVFIYSY